MGNQCCKPEREEDDCSVRPRNFKFPRWRSDGPIAEEELKRMRDEFWYTEPHYGGDRGMYRNCFYDDFLELKYLRLNLVTFLDIHKR
jgi:hypothetical protein